MNGVKIMRKLIALLGLLLLLACQTVPALASDVSLYYFGGTAEAKLDDEDELGLDFDSATGYGAELNLPVIGPLGVRVAYDDLTLEDITLPYGEPLPDFLAERLELGARKLGVAASYSFDLEPVRLQVFGGWSCLEADGEFDLSETCLDWLGSITVSGEGAGYEVGAKAEYAFTDRLKAALSASYMPDFDLDASLGISDLCDTGIGLDLTADKLLENCKATDVRAQLEYAFTDSFSVLGGYKWFNIKGDLRNPLDHESPKAEAALAVLIEEDPLTPEFTKQGWFLGGKFIW